MSKRTYTAVRISADRHKKVLRASRELDMSHRFILDFLIDYKLTDVIDMLKLRKYKEPITETEHANENH
jgi:hypothetical protein